MLLDLIGIFIVFSDLYIDDFLHVNILDILMDLLEYEDLETTQ